ncbi:Protein CBG18588 [Caenorhabditis briggsae]|uniref:Protein CBG18588 n=1 Tax=Caenorhabditis briggsae TaxID=6238 RepID=A8XTN2_CAEBR|nr:Protein CBG18588 [Caenorhabditis briggsae]CAP36008.1 Protein CBG18588 [Caenorhabditis briggsae]
MHQNLNVSSTIPIVKHGNGFRSEWEKMTTLEVSSGQHSFWLLDSTTTVQSKNHHHHFHSMKLSALKKRL